MINVRLPFVVLWCALLPLTVNAQNAQLMSPSLGVSSEVSQDAHIRKIEASVLDLSFGKSDPALKLSLARAMELGNIPGLSIAVIENYQLSWTKGYGFTDGQAGAAVTPATLFQAASVSKPVTAMAALALVQAHKLFLDEDVNRTLHSWKVPENSFTANHKVTLRQLITHTGGLTVHGFDGYDVDAVIPTLPELLDGAPPANSAPVRVESVPGAEEHYSGGGVVIEQLLMMDATGHPFPQLMSDTVLIPMGMADSTYEQPLSAALAARAASGTYGNGKPVHGRWHIYPEMGPAGLWSTPTDLSKFLIQIAEARQGKPGRVLTQEMATSMLTSWKNGGAQGFHLLENNPGMFSYRAENEGFEAFIVMDWKTGNGMAAMANSDHGEILWEPLLQSVAKEYGWVYVPESTLPPLILLSRLRGTKAALTRFDELQLAGAIRADEAEDQLNQLGYDLLSDSHNLDAIAVFTRNVKEHPKSSNAYDSLAEAYVKTGQRSLAIRNYQSALQRDPQNEDAKRKLKALQRIRQTR